MSWFKRIFSGKKQLMEWRAFAEHYAARLGQAAGVPVNVTQEKGLDEAGFVLKFEDGVELNLSVRNRYLNYQDSPEGIDEQLEYDLASIQSALAGMRGEGDTLTPEQVLPVIKGQDWGAGLPDTAEIHIKIALAGDLVLTFVADSEHSMRYLKPSDIRTLGLADEGELLDLASQNLAAYAGENVAVEEQSPGLLRVQLDNVYDASMMLFIDSLRQQLPEGLLGNRVVFAVPARNSLLLCNEGDAQAISAMRGIVNEVVQSVPHIISAQLYLYDENSAVWPLSE